MAYTGGKKSNIHLKCYVKKTLTDWLQVRFVSGEPNKFSFISKQGLNLSFHYNVQFEQCVFIQNGAKLGDNVYIELNEKRYLKSTV